MEVAGIIEKVESSEWASPIVVAVKPGRENVRICGDYTAVNKVIQNQTYLSPSIETAFSKMANKVVFCKLDLSDAYYQIPLSETSKDITTINNQFGRFRLDRLPYGIKISPAVFQREMEKLVGEHLNISFSRRHTDRSATVFRTDETTRGSSTQADSGWRHAQRIETHHGDPRGEVFGSYTKC